MFKFILVIKYVQTMSFTIQSCPSNKTVAYTRLVEVPFVYSTNNTTLYKRLAHLYKTITSVNFVL